MSNNFQVSDDFLTFEAEHRNDVEAAGQAEKRVMGINMPLGTAGIASILKMDAGKSKVKVDPKTKQQTGGNPMVTVTFLVQDPSTYRGQKVVLYFPLNATKTQTVQDKYQRFYDTMQDCGMPEALRGKSLKDIFSWAAAEERNFNFEVVPHWSGNGDKEFKPLMAVGELPTDTDIQEAVAKSFAEGEAVTVAGNPATVKSVNGTTVVVQFASGESMDCPIHQVKKVS